MTISTIWVFAEAADGQPTTGTLELLTKARSLAPNVEAVLGGDGAAVAAAARRLRRHQGATPPAISAPTCPGRPWRRR